MKTLLSTILLMVALAGFGSGQLTESIEIAILRAEDSRRLSGVGELLDHPNIHVRTRAALAAGRIGDEKAIPKLAEMLLGSGSIDMRAMAAFAIGEIESVAGADALLRSLKDGQTPDAVRSRAVEAAGKISAAHPKDPNAKLLGEAIVKTLEGPHRERETILFAITAALRARPDGTDNAVAKFLASPDPRIRADAANTLSRIRAKNANEALRIMLRTDRDPIARANAARALGAAEDQESRELLAGAATADSDSRVRVSAIRSLAILRDKSAAPRLISHGEELLSRDRTEKLGYPAATSELLEIVTALGRLLAGTEDTRAVVLINRLRMLVGASSPEAEVALARVAPAAYLAAQHSNDFGHADHKVASAYAQGLAEFAGSDNEAHRKRAIEILAAYREGLETRAKPRSRTQADLAIPAVMQAEASFKPADAEPRLRKYLEHKDVYIRSAAASLLADRPANALNAEAIRKAFTRSLLTDKYDNDAQISLLNALFKLDKGRTSEVLSEALNAPDYLVRKRAIAILDDREAWKDAASDKLEELRNNAVGQNYVRPYNRKSGTRLGQVLNRDADYRRALARKNGSVTAVLATEKGTFSIDLMPEAAPLTVDNFVKLARSRYFDGLEVHRVVPNFVMQDGDPLGNGSGGPGWSIRCEVNMVPYERGAVGMALSGKDTGGSQWFVTHSPQPHLDGGYTVFGKVNETGMKVVDRIVRGDRILSVRIVGR